MNKVINNKAKSSRMTVFLNKISKYIHIGIIAFISLFFLALDLGATHIVGGNITYRKIGPNRFEVTLELRRDCNLGSPEAQFDDPAAIGIFSSLGALQIGLGTNGMVLIPYDDSDTLNNVIESDCGFEGAQVCVEEFSYVQEVTLPKRAGGYILSYQRCCRNASLNNVTDPLNTGATYTVRIPESAFDTDNDSPNFKQWPPVYICANEPLNFDNSATDSDGDSLVYKLCVPKDGATFSRPMPQPPGPPPYDNIVWQPPYDINNLLGGTPLQIDPQTGLITGTPNTVGQFLVGVCVEEYRNGVLIGTVNRDFQYNVRVCSDPPMADFDAPTSKCDGLDVDFTNTSTSATRYFWDFDYPNGVDTSTLENPTFIFPSSGTYDVFLKIIRGTDQCDDSIVKTISVFDAEFNVDFDTQLDECQSDGTVTYTFTDLSTIDVVGVVSESWSWTINQGGVNQTFNGNPLTVNLLPGDFSVSLEVTASNGCIGTTTKDINYSDFELQPDFEVAIDGCSDDETINIVLDDLTSELNPDYNIIAIDWTVTAGATTLTGNGDNAVVTIPRSDFVVSLLVGADNGCDSLISKDFKIINFIPSLDFSFSLDGCNADNNPLIKLVELSNDSVTYSSVISYNWLLNGTVLVGDSVVYESINEDTILAELSIEFEDGCFTSISKIIRLDEIRPQVNYTWTAEECPTGEDVTLALTFDSTKVYGYGYDELVWEAGTNGNISTYSGSPVLITVPKDSTVFVTLSTNFDNGCSDVFSNSFYPGDFAQIELVGNDLVLCPNEDAEIVIGGNPDFFYNWSPQVGLDLSEPSNPIVSIGEDTWYYVTVTDGLCSVNDSIFIDILEQIDLTITGQDFTCLGDVMLMVTGGVGAGVYEWSTTVDFATVIATGDTLKTTFTGKSQTFFARFIGEDCIANPAGFTVTNETPELDFVDPFEICVFDTVTYRILNNIPAHNLEVIWDDDPHLVDGQMTLEPTITAFPSDVDSFQLYFTVTNQFDCNYRDTLTILIGENPIVDFTYTVEDCGNFEVCFEVVGDFNGFPVWDLGDTTTTDDRFLVEQVCYNYPGAGEYIVTLSNVSAICPFPTIMDTIRLNDSIPLFEINNIEVCINSDVQIPIPEGAKGLEFSWCDINGNEISELDTLSVFVENNVSYILKVEDKNGCPFSDTIDVTVFDFNYTLNIPSVFCAGEEVETSIEVQGGLDFIYEWLPADCIVSGGDTANPIIVVNDTKTISVKVTHPTLGCVVEDQFTVTPTELIIEADASPDAEIFLGDSVEIFVVDQIEGDTYLWSTGETEGNIIVSPEETTTYTVTVTDPDGCVGIASITITVILPNCEEDVFLPNAFTPNGDDVNSILYVRSNFVDEMLLIIYNRWNEEVFRSTDIGVGWDGTFRGKDLAADSYAYYLTVTCVDGFTIDRSGSINLIR